MVRFWMALLLAGSAALACGGDDGDGLGALDLEGDVARGEEQFRFTCGPCHGDDGAGGSQGVDLREEVPDHSDRELVQIMANGEGLMPPTGLSDQQMADVLAFLREAFR